MSDVASSDWVEHRALFQGRVSGFERRVRMGPKVPDPGIDLKRGRARGLTGYEQANERAIAKKAAQLLAELEKKKKVEKYVDNLAFDESGNIKRDWLDVSSKYLIEDIIKEVCLQWGVTVNELKSERRTAKICEPRQVAMTLCKHLTLRSLPEIGRRMGDRDHTTVLHAIRKLQAKLDAVIAKVPDRSPMRVWVAAFKHEIEHGKKAV